MDCFDISMHKSMPSHTTNRYTTSHISSVQSFKETYLLKMCFVQQIEEKLKIKGFASKSSTGFILTFFPNLVLLVTVSRSGVTQQQESKLAWIAYTASLISSATICVIMLPKEVRNKIKEAVRSCWASCDTQWCFPYVYINSHKLSLMQAGS